MKKLQKALSLLLALALLVLAASGCGSASSADSGGQGDVPAAPQPAEGTSARTNASITVALQNVDTSLTPIRNTANELYPHIIMLYDRLMYLNSAGEYENWALKNYTVSEDGLTYDFEIYDTIVDSQGNPITASDIVFAIQKNIEYNMKPDFGKIDSVEKTGDYTVRLVLKQNMVYLFESLMWNTEIFSQKAFEESADEMATSPVSSAMYKVTSFVPDSSLTFERRDDYWQDESLIPAELAANTREVTFIAVSEPSQRQVAIETKTADIAINVSPESIANYENNPDYVINQYYSKEGLTLFFSGADSRAVGNDQYLRQAICYAIDVNGLIQGMAFGHADPMHDVAVESAAGYLTSWNSEEYYPYDLEKAKECLAKSSYDGREIEILVLSSFQRLAEMVQGYCAEAGINVSIKVVDYALLTQLRLDGTSYDLFPWSISSPSLAYNWSLRYDANAYSTGDATSRRDETLTQMLYDTWVLDGYTEENINAVHEYIKDQAYAYGLYRAYTFDVVRADSGAANIVQTYFGHVSPWASTFVKES